MKKIYSISSKILYRIKLKLNQANNSWDRYVNCKMCRNKAKRLRKQAVEVSGKKVVDGKLLRKIKRYCKDVFGDTSYWPWLAFYTELRGEFMEGWIPIDYYRFEMLPKVNPKKFMRFSEAKAIDSKLFHDSILEPLFFRLNGQYYSKDDNLKTKSDVQNLLHKLNDEIIIKPVSGRAGQHIIFKYSDEILLHKLPVDTDYLFQRVVTQHAELNRLYPHSVNTFRVLTYLDEDNEIKVKFIIIRFGLGGARVDNASRGGGWIFVQPNAKVKPMAYDKNGFAIGAQHPDTGTQYADLSLPFLSKIIFLCKKMHRSFPYTRIIGWDVFVDESGEAKLIEWNANNPFWGTIEARFGPFFNTIPGRK